MTSRFAGWHRPMLALAGVMVVAAAAGVVGLAIDDRVLLGAPIWLKPVKFAVSIALYALTWSWLHSLLTRGRRAASAVSDLVVACLVVEYLVIVAQVLRGRPSHFNVATPPDATLWAVMAISIVVLWLGTFGLTAQVLRAGVADPGVRAGIRAGAVIALVGLALGFLMTSPNRAQLAGMQAGNAPTAIGAHPVGQPDGGPGMPLTGWSTIGGDLRVPHFVGMHALQLLPLLALALGRLGRGRLADAEVRRRVVLVLGAGYAGLVAVVTWQAERGQPLGRPDGWTLGILAVLVVAVTGSAVRTLRHPDGYPWFPRSSGQRSRVDKMSAIALLERPPTPTAQEPRPCPVFPPGR